MDNVRWNNYALDGGFLQVPNILINHHEKLGIDEHELMFLIKITSHKNTFKIHDNKATTKSQKTAYRRRKSLRGKGLIEFKEHKEYHSDGTVMTMGFTYDISPLNEKLQELYFEIEKSKNGSTEDNNVTDTINDEKADEHRCTPNNTSYNTNYNTKVSTLHDDSIVTPSQILDASAIVRRYNTAMKITQNSKDLEYVEENYDDFRKIYHFMNKDILNAVWNMMDEKARNIDVKRIAAFVKFKALDKFVQKHDGFDLTMKLNTDKLFKPNKAKIQKILLKNGYSVENKPYKIRNEKDNTDLGGKDARIVMYDAIGQLKVPLRWINI